MRITIEHNFPQVAAQMRRMSKDIAEKAMASALNKTIAIGKTAMSKEIRQEFALPASKVSARLRITKATVKGDTSGLEAGLFPLNARGRSLNLANFEARQTSKGVTFKIKRNGPRHLIPGAFLINRGGTVMIRIGKDRLPLKALQTIDIAQMFNTRRINTKVIDTIKERFPEIFEREAKFYIAQSHARST